MHELVWKPLTAHPGRGGMLAERRPCAALQPYICCFWGGTGQTEPPTWVVPDTCVDLIFRIGEDAGRTDACFCGLGDQPYRTAGGGCHSLFAIRWYAWTAAFFSEDALCDTRNRTFAGGQHFPALTAALAPRLAAVRDFSARTRLAEQVLLARLAESPRAMPAAVETAVGALVQAGGNLRVAELLHTTFCSARQLERQFTAWLGCPPKTLAGLIRYQCLWRSLLTDPRWDVQDAVARFGFADQAHLLRSFKKYHGMTPAAALALVRAAEPVAFLQADEVENPVYWE